VRTLSGSSENGFTMRVSAHRQAGASFGPLVHGVTQTSALGIFARGRLPINFADSGVTKIPIASVPAGARELTVTNFDTDVGAQNLKFTLSSFDSTTGQGRYPVLFEAPPGAHKGDLNEDTDGRKYVLEVSGNLSGDAEYASTTLMVPNPVFVPQTDGNGEAIYNQAGKVTIVAQRTFEGGNIEISYSAGQHDTSVWEVAFVGSPSMGGMRIVLIR